MRQRGMLDCYFGMACARVGTMNRLVLIMSRLSGRRMYSGSDLVADRFHGLFRV